MRRHARLLLSIVLVAIAMSVMFAGASSALALPPKKMASGWYWPVGTSDFHGWDGFMKSRGGVEWHLAQDMPVPQGSPVYAIADGTIAESSPNSGYGGVLVVWHYTGAKQKFLAVYGHIIRMPGTNKGTKVKAGQIIGHVNNLDHCHFGIHPGNKYPFDGNPYRGSSFTAGQTYGFVDPVKFLKTHPAFLDYSQPALPLTLKVTTSATPTVLGTADGRVYYRVPVAPGETSCTVYSRALKSADTTICSAGATLPTFDTTHYSATATCTSFCLYDRTPVLTAAYSPRTPFWAHPVVVSGTLENSAGKAFKGATVLLERQVSASKWTKVAAGLTNSSGAYQIAFVPARSYTLRVRFSAPNKTYCSATLDGVGVAPKPGLHEPDTIASAGGDKISFGGALDVRHKKGSLGLVKLTLQKLNGKGKWVSQMVVWTKLSNAGKASSRYVGSAHLTDGGSWRVRASIAKDSKYAADTSAWVGFAVK